MSMSSHHAVPDKANPRYGSSGKLAANFEAKVHTYAGIIFAIIFGPPPSFIKAMENFCRSWTLKLVRSCLVEARVSSG